MKKTNKWHNAEFEKPQSGQNVLLRVEIGKDPNNVAFIIGYHSGYEYCDRRGKQLTHSRAITHYDKVTHWIELP